MQGIVYADANIYLNIFFQETKGYMINPCDEAIEFFNRVVAKEFKLGYSDFVIYEVTNRLKEKGKDPKIMDAFLKDLVADGGELVKADQEPRDVDDAKKLDVHYQDPLHAILARRIGCYALVSRDNEGFPEECCSWMIICKPESLV